MPQQLVDQQLSWSHGFFSLSSSPSTLDLFCTSISNLAEHEREKREKEKRKRKRDRGNFVWGGLFLDFTLSHVLFSLFLWDQHKTIYRRKGRVW